MSREEQIEAAYAQHYGRVTRILARQQQRNALAEAQNWRCCYCGVRMEGIGNDHNAPTIEHVIPRSKDGADETDNIVVACRRCNTRRGNQELSPCCTFCFSARCSASAPRCSSPPAAAAITTTIGMTEP